MQGEPWPLAVPGPGTHSRGFCQSCPALGLMPTSKACLLISNVRSNNMGLLAVCITSIWHRQANVQSGPSIENSHRHQVSAEIGWNGSASISAPIQIRTRCRNAANVLINQCYVSGQRIQAKAYWRLPPLVHRYTSESFQSGGNENCMSRPTSGQCIDSRKTVGRS